MTSSHPRRIFLLGATGTIGRATARALVRRGHDVVCFVRSRAGSASGPSSDESARLLAGATLRFGDVQEAASLAHDGFRGERFDALVSCLASRTGAPKDAWAIDHQAHVQALDSALKAGVAQMVLLSAICVQKIADDDLAEYLADCLDDPALQNRVLPIGGPGDAITPLQQGALLFEAMGRTPRFKHVPVALLDAIVGTLGAAGRLVPALAAKAELARIGRYYATESMLVWDAAAERYDADLTPSTGQRTLAQHYADLASGRADVALGEHAVF